MKSIRTFALVGCVGALLGGNLEEKNLTAVSLEVVSGSTRARILTKNGVIQCIDSFSGFSPQDGNPLDKSTIKNTIKDLKPGDSGITLTLERRSGDVIVRHHKTIIAIFRRDVSRTLTAYQDGIYPGNFCDNPRGDNIRLN